MNAPSTAVAPRRDNSPIEVLKNQVARSAKEFQMVLPSHISVDKFQRTIATAALSNPKLLECDRQSLLIAAMKIATDGLLPDGREAALVPFSTRVKDANTSQFKTVMMVQAMPMVYGLRKKVLQSGEVVSLQVGIVYAAEVEEGNFLYEIGIDPPIRHRPKLDLTDEQAHDDNIVAAYSIARIKNPSGGDPYWSVEVMPRRKINKIRQMSQTGAVGQVYKFGSNKGQPIEPKGPWVDWFGEMAQKSALRSHTKVLPMSGDLLDTMERDDAEERRAAGLSHLLQTEPDAPISLPSDARQAPALADQTGTEAGVAIDKSTGEVQRDARGMTVVDEATDKALDAGAADSEDRADATEWVEGLEKAFAACKTDAERVAVHEQHAKTISDLEVADPDLHQRAMKSIPAYDEGNIDDPHNGPATEQRGEAHTDADAPMWRKDAETALAGVRAAKNPTYLTAIEEAWLKARAAVEDSDLINEVEAAFTAKRKALRAAKGQG